MPSGRFLDYIQGLHDQSNRDWSRRIEGIQPLVEMLKDMAASGYPATLNLVRPVLEGMTAMGTMVCPPFHPGGDTRETTYLVSLSKEAVLSISIPLKEAPGDSDRRPQEVLRTDVSTPEGAQSVAVQIFQKSAHNIFMLDQRGKTEEDRTIGMGM